MSSNRKRVLICGASGFIGRNIAERLAGRDDLEVVGVYHKSKPPTIKGVQLVQADLRDPDVANRILEGVHTMIQAAATTSGSKDIVNTPYLHVTDNAVMNSLLFRSAYEQKTPHIIFFSCSVMYNSNDKPVKETDADTGNIHKNYFGVAWTKLYIEKMAEFYSRFGATKYTVIRHSNIYGPYDKFDLEKSHVFGATMTKVMTAKDGKVVVWGEGTEERDLLYVSDLVDYVEAAMAKQAAPFDLSNCGAGVAVSIDRLVKKVIAASGRDLTIEYDRGKPTIKTSLCLDCSKAAATLGWRPRVSLDEGIRKTLEWYRTHLL